MLPLGGIAATPNGAALNSVLFNKGNSSTEITNNASQPKYLDDDEEDALRSPTIKQNSVPYADPAIVSVNVIPIIINTITNKIYIFKNIFIKFLKNHFIYIYFLLSTKIKSII